MESIRLRNVLIGVVVAVLTCCALWSTVADAQEGKYPNKPIEVIVPFAAGGPTDIWVRIVTNALTNELGVPISIQYKPGAGSMVGSAYVAKQKPDGYVLLAASVSFISATFLEKESPPYDVLKDFTPIVSCIVVPNVLVSQTSSDLTSLDALVKIAKQNPGKLTCATPGLGTTAHLVLDVFKMHGVDVIAVPTKGGGPAATSLLGKHVDLAICMYNAAVPHIKSGTFRILAATDKMAQEPEALTFPEKGFPEAAGLGSWQGFFGPANLPKSIRDQFAAATRKVIQMPSVKKALEDAGYTLYYKSPDELREKMASDYKDLEKIVKAAGIGKYSK
jgi:tripartite-type tricarboxylate transporter receptor subunit TctC